MADKGWTVETLRQHIEELLEEMDERHEAYFVSHNDLTAAIDKLREAERRDHADIVAGRQGLVERVEGHIAQWEAWKVGVDTYMAANRGEEEGSHEITAKIRNQVLVWVAIITVMVTMVDLIGNHFFSR